MRLHVVTEVITQVNIGCAPGSGLYEAAKRQRELLEGWVREGTRIVASGIFEVGDDGKPIRQIPLDELQAACDAAIKAEEEAAKEKAKSRVTFKATPGELVQVTPPKDEAP